MRYVIGIGGLKRSGKDSLARALRDVAHERGLAFVAVAFAEALRDAAAAAYGVPPEWFVDDEKKDEVDPRWGITRRQMLINLGVPATLLGDDYDHWVKRWHIEVDQAIYELGLRPENDVVVAIPDVRRLNEAAAIHDAGGVNALVRRPGVKWNGHVTEALAYVADEYLQYDSSKIFEHANQHKQHLTAGAWTPKEWRRRRVFDAVVDNDSDVAALRLHAERVLDMVTKGRQ